VRGTGTRYMHTTYMYEVHVRVTSTGYRCSYEVRGSIRPVLYRILVTFCYTILVYFRDDLDISKPTTTRGLERDSYAPRSPRSTLPALLSPLYYPRSTIPALLSPLYYPRYTIPAILSPLYYPRSNIPAILSPLYYPRYTIPAILSPLYYPRNTIPALLSPLYYPR
jgi:hypothetical protein